MKLFFPIGRWVSGGGAARSRTPGLEQFMEQNRERVAVRFGVSPAEAGSQPLDRLVRSAIRSGDDEFARELASVVEQRLREVS